jgi:hypothetical protein
MTTGNMSSTGRSISPKSTKPLMTNSGILSGRTRSALDESNRTSVHVHLNVQEFHLNRLTSLMALYYTVENVITEWCGEHRVGNLFCLRGSDAPAIINTLRRFIKTNMQWQIREHHHYAALNANALHKFGSLEFRTLRGVTDPRIIKDWIGILRRLYDMSAEFPDPRIICQNFSAEGPLASSRSMMGEHSKIIRADVAWDNDQIRASLTDGIRMAQDLCYARDWSMFKGVEFKPDPFGRDPKKLLKRMQALGAQGVSPVQAALNELQELEDEEITRREVVADGFDDDHIPEPSGQLKPLMPPFSKGRGLLWFNRGIWHCSSRSLPLS